MRQLGDFPTGEANFVDVVSGNRDCPREWVDALVKRLASLGLLALLCDDEVVLVCKWGTNCKNRKCKPHGTIKHFGVHPCANVLNADKALALMQEEIALEDQMRLAAAHEVAEAVEKELNIQHSAFEHAERKFLPKHKKAKSARWQRADKKCATTQRDETHHDEKKLFADVKNIVRDYRKAKDKLWSRILRKERRACVAQY